MSKRRRLNERERNLTRWAAKDGYQSFRYGSARPVTLPRIFTGEARRSKVSAVMDVLRDWRLSPFEFEGSARAGVRSGLCMKGHSWHRADNEAEALVGEALHLMGAKRPTLLEGQRQYSDDTENCQWCRGPLDDEDRAGHRRFCCDECARSARTRNMGFYQAVMDIIRASAWYTVEKEKQPERPCQWCGTMYKPASLLRKIKTETCSVECNRAYVGSLKGPKKCLHCNATFTPRWVTNDKFCSVDCQTTHRNERRRAETEERHIPTPCEFCGDLFTPKKAGARFCGHDCRWRAGQARRQAQNERACMECGTVFTPVRKDARFCSRTCVGIARERRRKQESAFICEEVEPQKKAA